LLNDFDFSNGQMHGIGQNCNLILTMVFVFFILK